MTDNNHLSIAPAVEAGPVPEGFRPDFARAALMGDDRALDRAFDWDGSKKGHDYWEDQWWSLRTKSPLTDEAASILREWIKQVEGEKP